MSLRKKMRAPRFELGILRKSSGCHSHQTTPSIKIIILYKDSLQANSFVSLLPLIMFSYWLILLFLFTNTILFLLIIFYQRLTNTITLFFRRTITLTITFSKMKFLNNYSYKFFSKKMLFLLQESCFGNFSKRTLASFKKISFMEGILNAR